MSNLSEFIGGGIKSVQSGTTTVLFGLNFVNVTLTTAIDPAKSFIMINGTQAAVGTSTSVPYARATIINSTTIRIEETNPSTSNSITVNWTVVEYY